MILLINIQIQEVNYEIEGNECIAVTYYVNICQ